MKKHRNKYTLLLVCLLLTVAIAVSGTIAYLFTASDPVVNTFTPVTPEIEIPEKMEGTVKEKATVQNTGDVDSYLRAKIVVTWQNSDGEVYPKIPVLKETSDAEGDYTMSTGAHWKWHSDGYYYYYKVAAPGEPAVIKKDDGSIEYGVGVADDDMLIIRAEVVGEAPAEGYTLHIEILGQAIQAEPVDAIKDAWGVTISSNQEGYVENVSNASN